MVAIVSNVDMSKRSTLAFNDESFDAAVMIEAPERLMAPVQAASEIRRILKPRWRSARDHPNVPYRRRRFERSLVGGSERSVTLNPSSLRQLLLQAGFNHVGVEGHHGAIVRDLPTKSIPFPMSSCASACSSPTVARPPTSTALTTTRRGRRQVDRC
jgi:hypothetical protein